MRDPTRLKVSSTHSATSSKIRGMSGLGLQHQGEVDFDGIADGVRALPVALAHAEIQAVEFGAAGKFGPRGTRNELKVDGHVLGDAAQGQRTDGGETAGGLGDGFGEVVRHRIMSDIEDILAAYRRVAILVQRVNRVQIDLHIDSGACKGVGGKIYIGGELVKHALELGARLNADKFQAALLRICAIACDARGGSRGTQENGGGSGNENISHDRFSVLVNGSMRFSTSSLFQKWCLSAARMCRIAAANNSQLKVS